MDDKLVMFEDKMGKSLANLEEEFAGIRAGRANPHVLDKLRVDYYGTPSPIQSVANVSVPEPRMIQIQPWEASERNFRRFVMVIFFIVCMAEDFSVFYINDLEDKIHKLTDSYVAKIDKAVEAKSQEILTV